MLLFIIEMNLKTDCKLLKHSSLEKCCLLKNNCNLRIMQLVFIKLDFPFPALLISKEDAKAIEKILEEDEKKILTIFDNMKSLLSEYKVFVYLSIQFIVYLHVFKDHFQKDRNELHFHQRNCKIERGNKYVINLIS